MVVLEALRKSNLIETEEKYFIAIRTSISLFDASKPFQSYERLDTMVLLKSYFYFFIFIWIVKKGIKITFLQYFRFLYTTCIFYN